MKIVLVNGWHDDNKGDCGIVEATISLLKECLPMAKFSLVSTFPSDHPAFNDAHRHLLEKYPELEIIPSALPGYKPGISPFEMLLAFPRIMMSIICLLIGVKGSNRAVRIISDSDLVISKGGHIFYSRSSSVRGWSSLVTHLYPLIVARRFGVSYVILAQSIGPFKGFVGRFIAKTVFNGAKTILLRERISYGVAEEIGVDMSKVLVVPDVAFWLQADMSQKVKDLLMKYSLQGMKFWVVTVRTWPPRDVSEAGLNENRYLKEMARFISGALETGLTDRIVLVAHAIGPIKIEDDRLPTRQLMKNLEGFREKINIIDDDLKPAELVALYGSAELLVGTRFHSVIFALAGGTPVIAISYFGPKARGIMKLLDMEDFCIDIEQFTSEEVLKCLKALQVETRVLIREKVAGLRDQLKQTLQETVA